MDKGEAIKLVRKYKELVARNIPFKSIYLFGSYSRGDYREESDIDVAVIMPSDYSNRLEDGPKLWGYCRQVSTLIEPVILNDGESSPLYEDVMKSGILI